MTATPEGAEVEDVLDERIDEIFNKPVTEEPIQEEEVKASDEAEEVSEETEVKDDKTEESEKEESEQDPEKEGEKSELTLSQIADILGVDEKDIDVDENNKVVINTKIDGVEGKVSLAEARKAYQLEGHLNKQNMEVVETRKALQAEREQFQQERQQQTQQLDQALQLAFNELHRDYQNIDWDNLKVTDPQQFLVLKNEYQERQATLQQNYQHINQVRQQEQQQFHATRLAKLEAETQKIRTLIPGWDTEETFKKGVPEVRQALVDHGFNDQEIQSISEGLSVPPEWATRIVVLANKAMQYDKLQNSQSAVIKKIRSAPKIVSSGTVEKQSSATNLSKAIDNIKKTGEVSDDYLKAKGLI